MSASELAARFAGQLGIDIIEHAGLGPIIEVSGQWGKARISLFGGHVLSWAPRGQSDILWLSPTAHLDGRRAIRGGIPICWPWFGSHPSNAAAPSHGLARLCPWMVDGNITNDADKATIQLTLSAEALASLRQPELPPKLSTRARIEVGATLKVSLTTLNEGTEPAHISQALHTYLGVTDIAGATVRDLNDKTYLDSLDGGARKLQPAEPLAFDKEIDRIYIGSAGATLVDPGARRQIRVDGEGTSASLVVWNPWIDKARRLDDMPDEGYRSFVCLETANVADDAKRIPPGATTTLTAVIRVAPL